MTVYAQPGHEGAKVEFKARYENWISCEWVPPTRVSNSRTSPRSRASSSPRPHWAPQRTSSLPWTPRTGPPRPGVRPPRRTGR